MPTVTPSPAAFLWQAGGAASAEPEPRYLLGGVALPATAPGVGGDLLPVCDPWLAEALPYFRHALNRALAAQAHRALAGQSTPADPRTAACVETVPVDPAHLLASRSLRLPLLAGYPVSATFAERTTHHERALVRYRFDYILPPLAHEQSLRLLPMRQAAAGVLLLAIRAVGSPSHQGGRAVWQESRVEYVRVVDATFGTYESADFAHRLPLVSLTVEVALRSFDDTAAGLPFWGASLATVLVGDDAPLPLASVETRFP